MLAMLSVFFKYVVLDKNTYLKILNENGTYAQVTESIYTKIDNMLRSKNINVDIKESIITEDDIKAQTDDIISGFLDYLKTGKNNIKPIDSEIYKQRVRDVLGSIIKPSKSELSANTNFKIQNTVYTSGKLTVNNMALFREESKVGQSNLEIQRLMTRDQAEEKVREILKEKGLTEEQAIEKAKKKGITEDQALKILAGYGITIDDEPDSKVNENSPKSSNDNNGNNSSEPSNSNNNNSNQNSNQNSKEASQNDSSESNGNQMPVDKSVKSKSSGVFNKLIDEAGSNIEKEIANINLDKITGSDKLQKITKITSIFFNMFWIFIILPIILMAILIKINGRDFNSSLKSVRNAFLLSGLIMFSIFYGAYVLKIYEKIDINMIYFKDVIYYTIRHFLTILSMSSSVIFGIGLFLIIPTIKKFGIMKK
jgi:hypothetical protein